MFKILKKYSSVCIVDVLLCCDVL